MEGPSLVILKEELRRFKNKKVTRISGNTKQPKESLEGKTLKDVITWGKTIYLVFSGNIVTRTHFLLFGSYRIDDPRPDRIPRVEFEFPNGVVYFYSCAFSITSPEDLRDLDHRTDVLSDEWDESYVRGLLEKKGDPYLCDLLLDQELFAGAGNIVKNEVLFNLRLHPLTRLSDFDKRDRKKLIHSVRSYCENFYEWKKKFELRKHWQVYKRTNCRLCDRVLKREKLGKGKRSTFYCPHCQKKRPAGSKVVAHSVLPIRSDGHKESRLDH